LYINTKHWDKADALLLEHFQLNSKFLQQVLWGVGEKTRTSYIQQQESNKNTYFNFYSMEKSAFAAERALNVSMGLKGLLQRINDEINELSSDYRKSDKQIAKLNENIVRIEKQVALMSASDKHDGKQDLHEQLNTLQRKLASKVITYRHKTVDINYQQLMNMLSEKQAVIDFVIYREADFKTHLYKDEQLVALVAIPKKGIELVKLGGLMPVTDLMQILRKAFVKGQVEKEPQSTRVIKAKQALYEKLWQPLEKHLQGKTNIYVIPDGVLRLLSFEQLEDENGRKLNEAITLFQLKSVYDLRKLNPAK